MPLTKCTYAPGLQVALDYGGWTGEGMDVPLPLLPPLSATHPDEIAAMPAQQPASILQQLLPPCFMKDVCASGWPRATHFGRRMSGKHEPGSAMGPEGNALQDTSMHPLGITAAAPKALRPWNNSLEHGAQEGTQAHRDAQAVSRAQEAVR